MAHGDRIEKDVLFKWYERPGFWHTTTGNPVIVVPPATSERSWLFFSPHTNEGGEISGDSAEERVFGVAVLYCKSR
jgi:hypothetical protein